MRRNYLIISIICFIIGLYTIGLISATGTPSTLVVRTDANNSLLVTSATQTNPVTQGVFSSRVLKTDASGSLQVVLTGTVTPTYPQAIPASTCAAPSLGLSGNPDNGIAFFTTPSIGNCIEGAVTTGLTSNHYRLASAVALAWTNTSNALTGTVDINLTRTAAQLLGSDSSMAITRGTITTDLQVQNDTVTWNNAAVTFEGWQLAVTNTASNSASRPLNILGGAAAATELFYVRADGSIFAPTAAVTAVGFNASAGSAYQQSTRVTIANTAPTIGSGFGTSPSILVSNGTAAFTVDVGTGGTASSGVITMPAATTGWNCHVENRTGVLGNVANQRTMQIATTTTSVTVENQTISTGAVLAWTAGDDLALMCMGY